MSTRSGAIKQRHGIGRAGQRKKRGGLARGGGLLRKGALSRMGKRMSRMTRMSRMPQLPRFRLRLPRLRLPSLRRAVKEGFFRLCVLAGVVLVIFGLWQWLRPGIRIRVNADTVAAFRVPHRALGLLDFYAHRHEIDFPELLTVFLAENDFFPDKNVEHDLSVIEQLYIADYGRVKRRYNPRSLAPYVTMFTNLFAELEVFPVPSGWYEDEPSIMFGDSWGVEHNMQGNRTHMGTAIVDRENVRGRVPVVSMTHGRVEEAGWNNQLGYFVGITTINGTYYLYAHLDSLTSGLRAGQTVHAGQPLGHMGNTGGGRGGGNFPVHLHIGISPEAGFTRGRFWINPYPLLRFLADS